MFILKKILMFTCTLKAIPAGTAGAGRKPGTQGAEGAEHRLKASLGKSRIPPQK